MGYYTYYTIEATKPDGSSLDKTMLDKVDAAIASLDLYDFCGSDGSYSCYDKWYDETDDMLSISHDFPDVFFTVYGDGEESDDFWVEYYLNGMCQHEGGEIVYGEFDPLRLGQDGRYEGSQGTESENDVVGDIDLDEILVDALLETASAIDGGEDE